MVRGRLVVGLVRACHPEPTVTVTTVATAFAATTGRGPSTVWVALAVLAGQLSVGWSNDYIDRGRDASIGRRDKPIVTGAVPGRLVGAAAVAALIVAVGLSFLSGWVAALAHVAGLAAGWSYNLGLKATPWSPAPYAVGFAALPSFVVLGSSGHPAPPVWLVVAGALLGTGAHFANVLPDLDDDVAQGIVGLPHRLGHRGSTLAAGALLVAAGAVLAFGPPAGPGRIGVAALAVTGVLAVALVLTAGGRSRWPFRLAMLIALVDTALLLARGAAVLG